VIRYQNFISSGNRWTEIRLDNAPTSLIVGKNGAGKSTILDALTFCLFKKPFRDVTLDLLVNTITKKNTLIEVEFSIGDDQYKIVRGLKPSRFEIIKNGTLVNSTNNDDYQAFLEEHILHINHKAFCQVVVLGSASYTPFMELNTPQRRAIIENLLDLEIFSTMNVVLKKRIQDNDKRLVTLKNSQTLLNDRILQQEDWLKNRAKNNEETKARYNEQLDDYRKQIQDKKALILDLIPDEDFKRIEDESQALHTLAEQAERSQTKLSYQIQVIRKEIKFYETSCTCDTCKQEIDEDFKKTILIQKNEECLDLDNQLKEANELMKQYAEKDEDIASRFSKLEVHNNEQLELRRDINDLIKQGKLIKGMLDAIDSEEQTSVIDISALKAELEGINAEYDKAARSKETMSKLLKLLKDDGVKATVIKQYINTINKSINRYLSEMDFLCQFNLDENFNEIIKSRYRDKFVYNSFSEGEKMRIDLAILLTWREIASRRNSINTNILFFDEVLDSSLDADAIDSYLEIMKKLTVGQNVFIISHNDKNIDRIETCIKFVKKKGFSFVEGTDK